MSALPRRRTFVVFGSTAIEVDAVPGTYARPQRFELVTSTWRGAPVSVPFKTTVTFGLQPSPVFGLPFPSGGAATAEETARPATAKLARNSLTFMNFSFLGGATDGSPKRCAGAGKLARS